MNLIKSNNHLGYQVQHFVLGLGWLPVKEWGEVVNHHTLNLAEEALKLCLLLKDGKEYRVYESLAEHSQKEQA